MKRLFLTILALLFLQISSAQKLNPTIHNADCPYSVELLRSSAKSTVMDVTINSFCVKEVDTPRGLSNIISGENMGVVVQKGQPNLPSLSIPIIIDDFAKMKADIEILNYTEFKDIEIAPFKGDISRDENPDEIPYIYDAVYENDEFFPLSAVYLDSPYILRDFRAQNIIITPFAYNPVTKVLRVIDKIRIEVYATEESGDNVVSRRSDVLNHNKEFKEIYKNRFVNYEPSAAKYDIVEEQGSLLIICHDEFLEAMQPFVEWKKTIGRETKIVPVSETGKSADKIKDFIKKEYAENPELTYLLLVGDSKHIPGKYVSASDYSGYSDWWYGQLTGDDYYNELFVGRFSAEDVSHVTTQVDKVIHYERDINKNDVWLKTGLGISKRENQQGHNGEDDYQHIDNIRDDLLAYNYSTVYREYKNISDITTSADSISKRINEGVSIINYCNHGLTTMWNVCSFSNARVNALTNDNRLPYIISVACYNGKYDHSQPCFAEAWLRATNDDNGSPTGAIGGMFSYISQPWEPPMYGQDEMIDVLTESYSGNIKRTMGGVSLHGIMKILDYSQTISSYYGTYNTWNLFGDPTLTLRNDVPAEMKITHPSSISTLSTCLVIEVEDGEGAMAALTRNGEIMATATVNNGQAVLDFDAVFCEETLLLTVSGYNKITYQKKINVSDDVDAPLDIIVKTDHDLIACGDSTELTAYVAGGTYEYTYSWSPALGLNDSTVKNPIAAPLKTMTYICSASDGNTAVKDSVTIKVLDTPTELTATVDDISVILKWNKADYAEGYNVYRDGVLMKNNWKDTTFTDQRLKFGVYNYSVSSVCGSVESKRSDLVVAAIEKISLSLFANPKFIVERDSTKIFANVSNANSEVKYDWSPKEFLIQQDSSVVIAFPKKSTTFKLTVTCGSQYVTDSLRIDVLSAPEEFTATATGNDVCLQWDEVEIAELYRVRRNGETIVNYLDTTTFVDTDVPDGIYCYTVVAVKHALISPETEEICVEVVGLTEDEDSQIEIYPNPVTNKMNIKAQRIESITIYNVMGQSLLKQDVDSEDASIDLSEMDSGTYLLQIETGSGIVIRKINVIK